MRENTWQQDAQPEWPEAASETRGITAGGRTQAFPETGQAEALASALEPQESQEPQKPQVPQEPEVRAESPALSDPWENAHDPREVTVQLDGDALHADGRAGGAPDGSDGPVFVDESGRRSRRYRRIGMSAGAACAIYAVVIVATLLSGNSHAPWLPVPGQGDGKEADQVENSPLPADPAEPVDAGRIPPGIAPTFSDGTTPLPGARPTAPGASVPAKIPATSAAPKPTATKATPGPGIGPTPPPVVPTDPPTSSPPDPPATTTPTPTPTESPTGDGGTTGGGTETVADGGSDPTPVASSAQPMESAV
ncbi:hypothetical protein [Streptomyces resistomycificus]|uniref:hypothetical protein n=1 Tax=Streptomyces resistomycificus TaxID=67356 RepID=UPI000AA66F04|nr:hypothetical protein [Streptomyces resistomycificus]